MTTLYSSEKIRALAETGDQFWMGAWWILRQQEAARGTSNDSGRASGPHLHFSTRGGSSVTPNAADLGAPRIG